MNGCPAFSHNINSLHGDYTPRREFFLSLRLTTKTDYRFFKSPTKEYELKMVKY